MKPPSMGSRLKQIVDKSCIEAMGEFPKLNSSLTELPNAHEPYYRFLFFLASNMGPRASLELGVYLGTGLAHLAAGSPNGIAIGVDKEKHPWDDNLFPFYNCRVEVVDSIKFLTTYLGPPFDIIHLDTIHQPGHVQRELDLSLPLLSKNGVICIDDIDYSEDMWAWWQDLDLPKITLNDLHVTGYGVILPND